MNACFFRFYTNVRFFFLYFKNYRKYRKIIYLKYQLHIIIKLENFATGKLVYRLHKIFGAVTSTRTLEHRH